MTLGDKLSKLRKQNNYTQEQFADILGVSRQAISKWESDVAYPEMDKLLRICALYHCSLDYLVRDDVDSTEGIEPIQQKAYTDATDKVNKPFKFILRFAPLALYALWAFLLWAFYAAPLLKSADGSLYKWFGNSVADDLQPVINALISLGVISGAYVAALGVMQRFASKKANLIANLCSFIFQAAVFVAAMCIMGVCRNVGLECGAVVVVVATLTGVFALLQAVFIALERYFNRDQAIDLKPTRTVAAFRKFFKFVTLHKAVAIVVACVLVVGVALSVALPLTVGNIFRTDRVSRINLGDDYDTVERILGKPIDIDTDKLAEVLGDGEIDAISQQNVYYYCSRKAERLIKDVLRTLDKLKVLTASPNPTDALIIYARLNKLQNQLNEIEFPYIEVYFEDGAVVEVEYDSKFSTAREKDEKWNVSGSKPQKINFIPDEIPHGQDPFSAELFAQIFYTDGSYRLAKIYDLAAVGNAANGWIIEWSDHWGSYKRAIKQSANK